MYHKECGQNTEGLSISLNKVDDPMGKQETEQIRKNGTPRKAMNTWRAHPREDAILHTSGGQSLTQRLTAMEMRRKVKDLTPHIING